MKKPFVVGITGGSASGKTFFLKSLLSRFKPGQITVVSQDDYYKSRELQPLDVNGIENYDMPESIDSRQFHLDLQALINGERVEKDEYTFNNPALTPKKLVFQPAPIILTEGIFVFHFPELTSLFDLKVFIDAEDIVKLKRRISRDTKERGYTIEDILYTQENHVNPTYKNFIKPYKKDADLIVPNNKDFDKALEVITAYLYTKL